MKRDVKIRLHITPENAESRRITISAALVLLKHTRDMLVRAHAAKAVSKVRRAITSTEGALRHAKGLETWAAMLDRADKCPDCARAIALCVCPPPASAGTL